VGLYDVTATEIRAIAWTGAVAPAFPNFPRSQGLNGAAVTSGQPVIAQDVARDPRWLTTFNTSKAEAIFPVTLHGTIVGTIDVESDRVGAFTSDDEDFSGVRQWYCNLCERPPDLTVKAPICRCVG